MNINIYLEDSLAKSLNHCAKKLHQSRNAIIRDAIRNWVSQHEIKKWSKSILNFKGLKDFEPFESYRDELNPPGEDPLK